MINPYKNIVSQWESTGSPKGNYLFNYAHQSLQLLRNANPVKFTADNPVSNPADETGLTLGFFSGGTSGEPELVKHSPITIKAAVDGLLDRIGDNSINSVCCLPLWHVGGWMQLERAWATRGTVLFSDFRDLMKIELRKQFDGRWISLVPTQLQELIKFQSGVENLKSAKGIFIGGSTASPSLLESSRALGIKLFPCYGLSETAAMITLMDSEGFLQGRQGVGTPLSHAEIRINRRGHVEVKSSSLCLSRGEDKFEGDTWLKTQDVGRIDRFLNLTILGRSDQIINTGGEKVNPYKIEKILYATGLIDQCMVYGEPHEKWGQRIVACVCPQSIDLNILKKMVEDKLVGYMKPKVWKTMDKLPLTEMGKQHPSWRK